MWIVTVGAARTVHGDPTGLRLAMGWVEVKQNISWRRGKIDCRRARV
jgi:hypothetical protein